MSLKNDKTVSSGLVNESTSLTFLPNDCKQMTTEFKFWRSHKSTDWKVSWTGTPNALAASKNAEMFSMHLNAILLSLTFFTVPGWSALASLHKMTPSLRTSKKLSMSPEVLIGSPVVSLIHSRLSAASSSLYFELIWQKKRKSSISIRFQVDKRRTRSIVTETSNLSSINRDFFLRLHFRFASLIEPTKDRSPYARTTKAIKR